MTSVFDAHTHTSWIIKFPLKMNFSLQTFSKMKPIHSLFCVSHRHTKYAPIHTNTFEMIRLCWRRRHLAYNSWCRQNGSFNKEKRPSTTPTKRHFFIKLKSNKSYAITTSIRTKCVCVHGQFGYMRIFSFFILDFRRSFSRNTKNIICVYMSGPRSQIKPIVSTDWNAYFSLLIYAACFLWRKKCFVNIFWC